MGAYFTEDQAKGRLKSDFSSLYVLPADQANFETDIAAAESEVNGSVGKRYMLPITNAAALVFLQTLALDIFQERAWMRGQGDEVPKKFTTQAKTARDRLAEIAAGKTTLGGATSIQEPATGGAAILAEGNAPQFTHDQMEGF